MVVAGKPSPPPTYHLAWTNQAGLVTHWAVLGLTGENGSIIPRPKGKR